MVNKNSPLVAIGLGANLGNRFESFRKAIALLSQSLLKDIRISVCYETAAVLPANAPAHWDLPYLNVVLVGRATCSPFTLLQELKKIEQQLGRAASEHWAPRIIDLDILLWGDECFVSEQLTIPHPQLLNRWFALMPLAQLEPQWLFPVPDHEAYQQELHQLAHQCHIEALNRFVLFPEFVGILNITPDSFSDGNQYIAASAAVEQAFKLIQSGASVLDIGGQSTRPGATLLSAQQEWHRLEPVLQELILAISPLREQPRLSLDTFYLENARRAINQYRFSWMNDVSGNINAELACLLKETDSHYVATHHLGIPANKQQILSSHRDPLKVIETWGLQQLELANQYDIDVKKIILDPGLGFGKTVWHNLLLLEAESIFAKWNVPVMLGHSRKSFWNLPSQQQNFSLKDFDSACLAALAHNAKVHYWRVHDVALHHQAFANQTVLQRGYRYS